MKQELEVLEELDHPHVVRVIELLEDNNEYYVVMELLPDGNLLDFLNNISKKKVSFTERDAANLTHQILLALSYMHGHIPAIVHRDLKLENIMIQTLRSEGSKDMEIILKITDFGFACEIDPEKGEKLSLGSPMYTAPEVIKGIKYDARCDVWSLGVMTYMMLSNKPPFAGDSKEVIYRKVLNYEPDYACFKRFYKGGDMCTDFLKQCLIKDFKKRPTIAQISEHEWMKTMVDETNISAIEQAQIGINMIRFKKASVFQNGVIAFMTGLFTRKEEI